MSSWLPENVSTYGEDIDSLFRLISTIGWIWFFLTEGAIVLFLVRYRARKGVRARYITGNGIGQLAWILVPAAIVLFLDLWIDFRGNEVWARIKGNPPASDLEVRVAAKQFNWEFFYPGPDGKFDTPDDLQLANELHVPVEKTVGLFLRSSDVIHSLFIPNLRFKQDAVPGREIRAWFRATKTGKYEIPCAELCGFGHSGMGGWLYVHKEEEYKEWLSARLQER
jgi:cytochrome c oxidase subunit 2